MRLIPLLFSLIAITACKPSESTQAKPNDNSPPSPQVVIEEKPAAKADVKSSLVRINSTQQSWNVWQPWEKSPPRKRRALAAVVGPQQVLTTAELVTDVTYIEFESCDGTKFSPAKVIAADYEANLALLGPASEAEGTELFATLKPFEISEPATIGTPLSIIQIEENGAAIETAGTLQSVGLVSNFLQGNNFLTYRVKASMQSAAGSYSLPVLRDGKFAGVLFSYNSKDQLCDIASTDIVIRFLQDAADDNYTGFPSLGIAIARSEDPSFRQWLKLPDDAGGIFIQAVRKNMAADLAGLKKGDVLLAADGCAIDRRGYYDHPTYGKLLWGHLIRGTKSVGDTVNLSILREGKPMEIKATLSRESEESKLVPNHLFDKGPNYLVKGGLLFQELSRPLLEGFGEDWKTRAPLNLLDALENPENYEDSIDRVVFLTGVIPTPATVGYESLRSLIISRVNGKPIKNLQGLIDAFENDAPTIHSIEFEEENLTINLDEEMSSAVDSQLLQRGINRLSRAE
ncbi:MAG: PDZ domain-containing protein [Luteolibacter sp.]